MKWFEDEMAMVEDLRPDGPFMQMAPKEPTPTGDGAAQVMGVSRAVLREAIAAAIGSAVYVCGREWAAWSYGTMDEDDFSPLILDDDRLDEIIEAVGGVVAEGGVR